MMVTNDKRARRARLRPATRVRPVVALVLAMALPPSAAVAAEYWKGELQGGGEVRVDPRTQRPTVQMDGRETQLWDGVHQLEGGRELRVESGRVVPNEEILETRERWPEPALPPEPGPAIEGASPCERLVRKVCGSGGACGDATACGPARQLWDMEREEQRRLGTPGHQTYTSNKCAEALRDDFFTACDAPAVGTSGGGPGAD